MPVVFEHPVRFEEVDPAGIVFFARYFNWCHLAMEHFFDGVAGGYVDLITRRKIGFPTVHITADWKAPLRYGDVVQIATAVTKIGTTSFTFRYELTRKSDKVHVATVDHVVVASDLPTTTKIAIPSDVRSLLESHRASAA